MALVMAGLIRRLVPRIGAATILPRGRLQRLVGEYAKWRNDVFLEVLVLVVAPDHDKIGLELVQYPPRISEACNQRLAVAPGGTQPVIIPVFLAHWRRPARGVPQPLRHCGIFEGTFENPTQTFVRARKRRKVGNAEPQNLPHLILPCIPWSQDRPWLKEEQGKFNSLRGGDSTPSLERRPRKNGEWEGICGKRRGALRLQPARGKRRQEL